MTVRIFLKSKKGDQIYFDIIPDKSPIGQRWFEQLSFILKNKLSLEKNFCWLGFPDNPRQLPFLCEALNFHIQKINEFSDSGIWDSPYLISENFSLENFLQNGVLNQSLMNSLHHHFEILQGETEKPSRWYFTANNEVKFAIRQLNLLCHEIEMLMSAKANQARDPEKVGPASIVSFLNAPKFNLQPIDYDQFTLDRQFGNIFMHYCQIGKTHWEAYEDTDQKIGRSNIIGLQYYSGEFNIEWGPTYNDESLWWRSKKDDYRCWLRENNFDSNDKSLGHGRLKIGQLDTHKLFELVGSRKISDVHKKISNYLDICRIETICADGMIFNDYNQHWDDVGFSERQIQSLYEK